MQNCRMLKDIAAVKFAVEICNDFDIKREILCAPGSEYYLNEKLDSDVHRKELWTEILEKKTIEKLKKMSLTESIVEKITGLVLVVGTKMIWWTQYHVCMFGLSPERSVDILNSSVFTSLGIIDSKKAAELLMNEESLNIEQKYRLACIYCFANQLRILFKQIPRERKKNFCSTDDPEQVNQPPLIKFWSYSLMEEIDLLKGEKNFDQYMLEIAVKSGSLPAVEYCLKSPNIGKEKYIFSSAALAAVRSVLEGGDNLMKYDSESGVWIPKYYYTNIICFLLSKMEVSEKIIFLKKDIEGTRYEDLTHREEDLCTHSNVLEYFLDWPYQWFFLDTEKLIREFLPPRSFAYLLLKICNKIENDKEEAYYGEEKCFDYRNLLRYFWLKSLDCCKKYILHDGFTLEGKYVLIKLFNLKIFTNLDLKNILLILNYATYDERKNIISSDAGKKMCFELMRKEWWYVLDKFVLKCFSCKDETKKFKKDLIFTDEAKLCFANFIQDSKVDAIQCFIDWISLSDEELVQYKEEIIFSYKGRRTFMNLILKNGNDEREEKLFKFLLSSEKANEFKKTLLSDFDFNYCSDDINGNFQRIENFLQWATSSVDEIKKFKQELIYKNMDYFEWSITICTASFNKDLKIARYVQIIYFDCSDWISLEKLLTWCLSSEKEILEYKKVLLERFGVKIHFQLIRANQWAEADTFFAWLGLNISEILKLKRDTIFENIGTILDDLAVNENYSTYDFVDCCFSTYGGLQDRIELLLRWCLCDKESVLEFKSLLEERYAEDRDFTNILNTFNLAIEEYLIELEPDHSKSK